MIKQTYLVGRFSKDGKEFCLYFTKYTTHENIDRIVYSLNKQHPTKEIKAFLAYPAGSYDPDPC